MCNSKSDKFQVASVGRIEKKMDMKIRKDMEGPILSNEAMILDSRAT